MERTQEICHRSGQRPVGHSRRDDKGKGQEVDLLFHFLVDSLQFSAEYLAQYKEVLADAVEWYRRSLVEKDKWVESYVEEPSFSLLAELRKRIKCGEDVSGEVAKLMAEIVKRYSEHLTELKKLSWINKETVEHQEKQLLGIKVDATSRLRSDIK